MRCYCSCATVVALSIYFLPYNSTGFYIVGMVSIYWVQASLGCYGCIYATILFQFESAIWKQILASVWLALENCPYLLSALIVYMTGFVLD